MKILSALWDLVKAVFVGKFLGLNVYIREGERFTFIHPSCNFRKLNKEEQVKSTGSRRKEINIREGSNEYENCESILRNQ